LKFDFFILLPNSTSISLCHLLQNSESMPLCADKKKTALWVGHSSALWPKVANAQRLLFSIDFRHLNRITENPTLLNPHLYLLKTANLRHFSDVNLNGKQIIVRKNNFPFK